jgi:hypothetical protein
LRTSLAKLGYELMQAVLPANGLATVLYEFRPRHKGHDEGENLR